MMTIYVALAFLVVALASVAVAPRQIGRAHV